MNATAPRATLWTGGPGRPIPFALLTGTSFIGICWLLEPVLGRLGLPADPSRGRLLFVGVVYAIALTWFRQARGAAASRPVD